MTHFPNSDLLEATATNLCTALSGSQSFFSFCTIVLFVLAYGKHSDGEDDLSVAVHITTMNDQLGKSSVDYNFISDRMQRTYVDRRKMALDGLRIDLILEKYPALCSTLQVLTSVLRFW